MTEHRLASAPSSRRASSGARLSLAGAALVGIAAGSAALAGQTAPSRPPSPFAVFVEAPETGDAETQARLEEAVAEVSERVARRRRWFRIAAAPEEAALTLQITGYVVGTAIAPRLSKQSGGRGSATMFEGEEVVELHNLDAVATAGDLRWNFYGRRAREVPNSLRRAGDDLAEALEGFCRENYAALTAVPPPPSS